MTAQDADRPEMVSVPRETWERVVNTLRYTLNKGNEGQCGDIIYIADDELAWLDTVPQPAAPAPVLFDGVVHGIVLYGTGKIESIRVFNERARPARIVVTMPPEGETSS